MSSVKNIFDVSGRAMAAQMIRLNTVASNLANSNNTAGASSDDLITTVFPIASAGANFVAVKNIC